MAWWIGESPDRRGKTLANRSTARLLGGYDSEGLESWADHSQTEVSHPALPAACADVVGGRRLSVRSSLPRPTCLGTYAGHLTQATLPLASDS